MDKKRNALFLICTVVVACIVMAITDAVWQPGYALKSFIKVILFLLLPFTYSKIFKCNLKSVFKFNKKGFKNAVVLGVVVFGVIFDGYMCLKNVLDFSMVTGALGDSVGVSKDNFVFVAIYISFVNSLLEEFFFRGYSFLTLKKLVSKKFAYIFSAFMFALYHVAIMTGWFGAGIYALLIGGLFAGGLIFNFLNDKFENIYISWFVHMFANFAINTIGFILFGIIKV